MREKRVGKWRTHLEGWVRCFIAVCDGREAAPASHRLKAQASHLFCLAPVHLPKAKLTMTPPHLILSSRDHVVIAWTYRTMRSPEFSVAHVLPWHDVNVADQSPSGRIVATGSFVRIHPQLPQFILISLTSSRSNNQIPAGCVALNTSCGKWPAVRSAAPRRARARAATCSSAPPPPSPSPPPVSAPRRAARRRGAAGGAARGALGGKGKGWHPHPMGGDSGAGGGPTFRSRR